ncbi:MAG: YihY/virulence factor BrkB family protein, partial [Acidobacteriia bacterium]|nr:YihY/virulence factor BrkB family protein [Terriglobia bacterium]
LSQGLERPVGAAVSAILTHVRLNPRSFVWLLRRSLVAAFDDGCLSTAKGAAYSALLSFLPVLASAATILVQTRAQFISRPLEDALSEIVPPGSEGLVVQQFRVSGARPLSLLIVAGVVSVWAASGVIQSLIEGFQAAYRVPRSRGFLHQSGVAMALVLPSSVDTGQVSAHYDKGVLKINLAKKAEAKPKQIKVNVGSEKTLEAKVHGKAA